MGTCPTGGSDPVGFLVVIFLFGAYFIMSFRIYFNCDMSKEHNIYGVACFLAFCGYLTVGIFNDSVVCVAPVFWVLLGLGIAMNELARKDKAADVSKISTKKFYINKYRITCG